jgi:peptide chain release factor 1
MDIKSIKKEYNLAQIEAKKKELEDILSTAHTTGANISELSEELSYTTKLFEKVTKLFSMMEEYEQSNELLNDKEMAELAQGDVDKLEEAIPTLHEEIVTMEIARSLEDPDDNKPAIIEIRAGAGGEEAALFAADLFRMYEHYANNKSWTIGIIDSSVADNGGYKEIIAHIDGKGVYRRLKYESGVHRVQRIPITESAGRIHTSTASVAVLPEAEEVDIDIDPQDLKIDVMRSSGPGGQSVNTTDSAVRITHLPTGIVVSCQETKYQHQNKEKAMQILRSRLYEQKREELAKERSDMRSSQIGTAMRAEKIRTYNFPQSRVTDHRVKVSWHNLEQILYGELDELIDTVTDLLQKELLKEIKNGS